MSRYSISSTRATITALPPEILSRIASSLTGPSAAAFALIAPGFRTVVEPYLWREIRLSLPISWGRQVLIIPEGIYPHDWPESEELAGAKIRSERLAARVKGMVMHGNPRRWGAVRRMVIPSDHSTVHGLLFATELASPNLSSLELVGSESADVPSSIFGTLEFNLFHRKIFLPALVHLRIHSHAIHFPAVLVILVESAPALRTLDVDLHTRPSTFKGQDGRITLDDLPSEPKLNKLRGIRYITDSISRRDDPRILERILQHNNGLEQLVAAGGVRGEYQLDGCKDAIAACEALRDLCWRIEIGHFNYYQIDGFPALRRLVLDFHEWSEIFCKLPELPNLETIYLILPYPPDRYSLPSQDTPLASPFPPFYMTPNFSAGLLGCPKLHAVHLLPPITSDSLSIFTELDAYDNNTPSYLFRSLRHGEDQILHARICMPVIEMGDIPVDENHWGSPVCETVSYTAGEERRVILFGSLPVAVYQDFTDHEGEMVPLAVLDQMAAVEGLGVDWKGRGVEVGEEAWKVLLDWRRSILEDEKLAGE